MYFKIFDIKVKLINFLFYSFGKNTFNKVIFNSINFTKFKK